MTKKRSDRRRPALAPVWLTAAGLGLLLTIVYSQTTVTVPGPVQKILSGNCASVGCHQGKYPAMNISFEPDKIVATAVNVASKEKPSLKIIDTTEPGKSYLLMKIRGDSDIGGQRMPLGRSPLKEAEIQAIQAWLLGLKSGVAK